MKTLVVYDTYFGNTLKIADEIAKTLSKDSKVTSVDSFHASDLKGINMLIVGSPILAWKPSEKTQKFLASLSPGQLNGIKATSFDTRVRLFIHGDAAKTIANELIRAGAELVIEPKGFEVKGREGPLFEGELEKARQWAMEIKTMIKE